MRFRILSIFIFMMSVVASEVQARDVIIATVSDGPLARQFVDFSIIQREINNIVGNEFKVSYPSALQVHGDWSEQGIQRQLHSLLNNSELDIIITLGIVSSHLASKISNLAKPVIAPYVVDIALQGIPYHDNASGKNNFVYTRYVSSVSYDLERFHKLVGFHHLAIVVDELPVKVIPSLKGTAKRTSENFGFEISLITGENDIQDIASKIPDSADAVLVASLLRVDNRDIQTLANYLIEQRLPSFSFLGQQELKMGLMATISGRDSDQIVFARRIATNVYRILLNTPASKLNVDFYESDRLSINMQTARAIGVSSRWVDIENAELLYDDIASNAQVITLQEAMSRAIEANIDFQASQVNIDISENNIGIARSALLPQLNANTAYTTIDQDRATPQNAAENSVDAGIKAAQTIYSDAQWANYTIAKYFDRSTDLETKITLLNTL